MPCKTCHPQKKTKPVKVPSLIFQQGRQYVWKETVEYHDNTYICARISADDEDKVFVLIALKSGNRWSDPVNSLDKLVPKDRLGEWRVA